MPNKIFKTIKFTLIESLVVMAIRAILMILRLPAPRKTKNMAAKIKCLGSQKQSGLSGWNNHSFLNKYAVDPLVVTFQRR